MIRYTVLFEVSRELGTYTDFTFFKHELRARLLHILCKIAIKLKINSKLAAPGQRELDHIIAYPKNKMVES